MQFCATAGKFASGRTEILGGSGTFHPAPSQANRAQADAATGKGRGAMPQDDMGDVVMIDKQLIDLNRRVGEAEKSRDDTYLSDLMADDLVFQRASGVIVNKAHYLNGVRDPTNSYSHIESTDIEAKMGDKVAAVTVRVCASGVRSGKEFSGVFRNIRVFRQAPNSKYGWECYVWVNFKEI